MPLVELLQEEAVWRPDVAPGCEKPHAGPSQLFGNVWFDGTTYSDAVELWEASVKKCLPVTDPTLTPSPPTAKSSSKITSKSARFHLNFNFE
eukprot:3431575-Amphidinium_carterae.1